MSIQERINSAEQEISKLVDYIQLKIKQQDWHGVADAAMDIRELEERKLILKEFVILDTPVKVDEPITSLTDLTEMFYFNRDK